MVPIFVKKNPMKCYREIFSVKSYETDHNGLFKPFSFLNHAQEMANIHAHTLGFGYDNLISTGVVWVLSRFHIKFQRLPVWKEEVSMETWHKGSDRLFGFRDFLAHDSGNNEIISATSSWLIIDYKTRRLQKIESILGTSFKGENQKDAIQEPAERLTSPKEMAFSRTRVVSLSDLDINGHTNNARYFEWAIDSLPLELTKEMTIREMWLNFNNESLPGESVDLYTSVDPDIFIEGKRGDTSIFQLKIKGQPIG